MLVDVVVAALVVGAATTNSPTEGVPPWLIWAGSALLASPLVAALGRVLVKALAKRLGVQDDTEGGTHEASPATRVGPEQSGQEAPAERYDARMAIIEQTFRRQDERIAELADLAQRQASILAQVTADRDRIAWEYEQATGRPAPGPPPNWPGTPSIPPPGGSSQS